MAVPLYHDLPPRRQSAGGQSSAVPTLQRGGVLEYGVDAAGNRGGESKLLWYNIIC